MLAPHGDEYRQRIVHHGDHRGDRQREGAQDQRVAEIERRGRDDDRRDEHQSERIGDAAREIEKNRQLQHVIGQIDRRFAVGEAVARRIAQGENHVESGAERNAGHALDERQRITEAKIDDDHRHTGNDIVAILLPQLFEPFAADVLLDFAEDVGHVKSFRGDLLSGRHKALTGRVN